PTTTTLQSDTNPPTVPANPSASAMSCSQINTTWSPSSDTGTGVAGYKLYRNNAFVKQVGASSTSTSDTGLAGSTLYSYHVSAVDGAHNESARSAAASRNTPACPAGGVYQWSRQMGGTVSADSVAPYAVVADASGNVIVTGSFTGTVNFGTGSTTSAGGSD